MEELLRISIPKPRLLGKPVSKKIVGQSDVQIKHVYAKLCDEPAYFTTTAYLLGQNRATYGDKIEPRNDYLYGILQELKRQHIEFLGETPLDYKCPFTTQGFKFVPARKTLIGYDNHGLATPLTNLEDKKVSISLRIKPYDIIRQNKRLVGLTIFVNQIKQI